MCLANCISDYITGEKNSSYLFPEDGLRSKRIYFVNRKDWLPTKYSVICIKHFETKFVKEEKKCKLQ